DQGGEGEADHRVSSVASSRPSSPVRSLLGRSSRSEANRTAADASLRKQPKDHHVTRRRTRKAALARPPSSIAPPSPLVASPVHSILGRRSHSPALYDTTDAPPAKLSPAKISYEQLQEQVQEWREQAHKWRASVEYRVDAEEWRG
ncbi:hypothetical protein PENTCL1PPCAC_9159, partial [Pristionchus entomophagus]